MSALKGALLSGAEHLQRVRGLIPASAVPAVVQRRLDKLWTVPAFREMAESQMQHLLEHTPRAAEAKDLAYGYAEQMMLRSYLRWHPRAITKQRVTGIEWLTTKRDPHRGQVINFLHHHRYDGMWSSLARQGATITMLMSPLIMGPGTAIAYRQHRKIVSRDTTVLAASTGTAAIVEALEGGQQVAIASDVPGQTPVTFLGRRVLGSFGAARTAALSGSTVVLARHLRDEAGPYIEISEPIEPGDFADPSDLLAEMLRRHEEAVLAWPEALDAPKSRFGPIEEPSD